MTAWLAPPPHPQPAIAMETTSTMAAKRNITFVTVLNRSGIRELCIFSLNVAIAMEPEKLSAAPLEARMPDDAVNRL